MKAPPHEFLGLMPRPIQYQSSDGTEHWIISPHFVSLDRSQAINSNDLLHFESMIPTIDHVPLSTIKKTVYFMETKLIWMIGHHHHEWSHARRRLVSAMHERTRALSTMPLSINLPDSCIFRAIHFEVHSESPMMTFAFSSRRRNGPSFSFNIATHKAEFHRVLRGRRTQQYMHCIVVPHGVVINGTVLLMVHSNGMGIQIVADDQELLTTTKLLKFGKAPLDISIYQTPNVSAVTDMYCLSAQEFCAQYPSRRGAWTEMQVSIAGKSVFPVLVLKDPTKSRGPGMTEAGDLQKETQKRKDLKTEKCSDFKPCANTVDSRHHKKWVDSIIDSAELGSLTVNSFAGLSGSISKDQVTLQRPP